jgi:hypothetical protein
MLNVRLTAAGGAFVVENLLIDEYGPLPASLLAQMRKLYSVSSFSLVTLYE